MLPNEIKNKNILLSPLNWGMGHVARCIPLISTLIKNGNQIFIAVNEDQKKIFIQYFSEIIFIKHAGYPFQFGEKGNFALDLAKKYRSLKNRMDLELLEVEKYVDEYSIEIVISDHRYGFRSSNAHSILLTHQLNLPIRFFERWVQKIHNRFLSSFDEIWVPDSLFSDLSGDLSINKVNLSVSYIGILSRFSLYDESVEKSIDKVIIVSGPLVYAEKFLNEHLKKIKEDSNKYLIIIPNGLKCNNLFTNVRVQVSDDWQLCDRLILQSKKIISRSGYSTLMDLYELKTPFSISPTPGQREQEYLYSLWDKKSFCDTTAFIENKEKP